MNKLLRSLLIWGVIITWPAHIFAWEVSKKCEKLIAIPRSINSEDSTKRLVQSFLNSNNQLFDPDKSCKIMYSLLSSRKYMILQIGNRVLVWKNSENELVPLTSKTLTDAVKEVKKILES
jgi:hypothetical protein